MFCTLSLQTGYDLPALAKRLAKPPMQMSLWLMLHMQVEKKESPCHVLILMHRGIC